MITPTTTGGSRQILMRSAMRECDIGIDLARVMRPHI